MQRVNIAHDGGKSNITHDIDKLHLPCCSKNIVHDVKTILHMMFTNTITYVKFYCPGC